MVNNYIRVAGISIHALVKRATSFGSLDIERLNISIHALVKRATEPLYNVSESDMYFNPRPREEGDDEIRAEFGKQEQFQSTPS
mgnify:CR=1 FL=1